MARKHALLGILVITGITALYLCGPGVSATWAGGTDYGALPVVDGRGPSDGKGGVPGSPDADPDWFGTNGYSRVQIVQVEDPAPRSGWIVLSPYSGLLDWFFNEVTRHFAVTTVR